MNTEIDRFHADTRSSAALRDGLRAVSGPAGFVAFANAQGYRFDEAALAGWNRARTEGDLSGGDLEGIVGGRVGAGPGRGASTTGGGGKGTVMDAIYEAAWRTFWY
ncbi:Nif11-like leader peptide family natural product precursor [Roseomonas sp. 18066]|uniref:Nif11-like leader peptide family natural product precursor n=1 Tax=Roseomonas sp. 18066 TaxID=2681412 RepID=UPI00135C7B9C|nr:Nif11-like leader peptide family natural product precursor [Roseomonas sp. 18066]